MANTNYHGHLVMALQQLDELKKVAQGEESDIMSQILMWEGRIRQSIQDSITNLKSQGL